MINCARESLYKLAQFHIEGTHYPRWIQEPEWPAYRLLMGSFLLVTLSTFGNNRAQNKQFKDATKGLPKRIKRIIHDEYSNSGAGYHDIKDYAKNFWHKIK